MMVTLTLDPQSDIAKALASVDSEPVVLISNGERFRVSRDQTTPLDDDEEFEQALRAVVGTLTSEAAEQRIQDIYRWREEGTRPIDRP
jgi:hypothetical protein